MIPAIELFCGMGGATEGMTRAGVTVIAAVDKWSAACDAHRLRRERDAAIAEVMALEKEQEAEGGFQELFDEACQERDAARTIARALAHFHEIDHSPPPGMVAEALAFEVGQRSEP